MCGFAYMKWEIAQYTIHYLFFIDDILQKMEDQMNKIYYQEYNLGTPVIYFHNKELCIKDKWDVYATCKGELAAGTESITHCFMKLNFKLIHLFRYIFSNLYVNTRKHIPIL